MTHGSLFSGIGGFDLAAEWCGWQNLWHCEIDPFASKVLAKNFPNITNYGDITKADWASAPTPDVISGGFPCQPFSQAGRRRGKEDDRYLWPAMLEVIRTLRPTWVVGENVAGFIGMGLDDALSDLEAQGYETWTYVLPACAVGAQHRRDRVWIVAHNRSMRIQRLWERQIQREPQIQRGEDVGRLEGIIGRPDLYAPKLCRSGDGIPNRVDRIRALGNAIVPQVAYRIFQAISLTNIN